MCVRFLSSRWTNISVLSLPDKFVTNPASPEAWKTGLACMENESRTWNRVHLHWLRNYSPLQPLKKAMKWFPLFKSFAVSKLTMPQSTSCLFVNIFSFIVVLNCSKESSVLLELTDFNLFYSKTTSISSLFTQQTSLST